MKVVEFLNDHEKLNVGDAKGKIDMQRAGNFPEGNENESQD